MVLFIEKMRNNSGEFFTPCRLIASEKLTGLDPRNTHKAQFLKKLCLIIGQEPFNNNL